MALLEAWSPSIILISLRVSGFPTACSGIQLFELDTGASTRIRKFVPRLHSSLRTTLPLSINQTVSQTDRRRTLRYPGVFLPLNLISTRLPGRPYPFRQAD